MFLKNLLRDDAGTTSIEYGLILTFISTVIVLGVYLAGESVTDMLEAPAKRWPSDA